MNEAKVRSQSRFKINPCLVMVLVLSFLWSKITCASNEDFFKNKTNIKNPFSLRDPFKIPNILDVEDADGKKVMLKDGVYKDTVSTEGLSLSEIKIIGVLVGKERRAMALLPKDETIILKEGMQIGKDKSEIKAILPGGIVLVEKIVNVYGQEEYLETIIPITKKKSSIEKGDKSFSPMAVPGK